MGAYLPLFSVEVMHDFFAAGWCQGLEFVPTPQSNTALYQAGLLSRTTQHSISVFYDEANADRLQRYVTDPDEPFHLGYKVFSHDPFFHNYTEPAVYRDDAMLYFANQETANDTASMLRLHAEDYVSEADFHNLEAPLLTEMLSPKDRLVRPMFLLHLSMSPEHGNHAEEPLRFSAKRYGLQFKSRQTFWKYYLLGEFAREAVSIVDLDHEIEFASTGEETLSDNRVALTFRSKTAIPLREKSDCRFQLRGGDAGNGKVLMRRLPVASARQINRDVLDNAIVSEMFVNC